MKLKTKKFILTTGLIAAAATTALAASCSTSAKGRSGGFNTQFDNKINVEVAWTRNQLYGITELSKVYNELHKNDEDFVEVVIKGFDTGYTEAAKSVNNELVAKSSNLPNIVINYPGTLAQIADAGMDLALDSKTIGDQPNKYIIDGSSFEKPFLTLNNRVGGIPHGQIYALPIAKSTDVLAVNAPVLSYIFESMVSLGATVDESDAEFKKWYDSILQKGRSDREFIQKSWGSVRQEEKPKYENGKFKISKAIFETVSDLLDFSQMGQDLFTNTHNNLLGRNHTFTISQVFNTLATSLFALNAKEKDDYSNAITSLKPDGFVDYDKVLTDGTPAFNGITKITNKLSETLKNGGLSQTPSFTTNILRVHETAFAYSSNAGYSFSFFGRNDKPDILRIKFNEKFEPAEKDISTNVAALGIPNADSNFPFSFQQWGQRNSNRLLKSDATAMQGRFDLKFVDTDSDALFTAFIDNLKKPENKDKKPILIYKSADLDKIYEAEKTLFTSSTGIEFLGKTKWLDRGVEKTNNLYGIVDISGANPFGTKRGDQNLFEYIPFNDKERLQEDELSVLPAPTKWDKTNKINSVYLQGPSIMALHTNDKEDIGTLKFLKWLTTTNKFAFQYRDGSYKNASGLDTQNKEEAKKETPFEYLSNIASYVIPYKGAFDTIPPRTNIFTKVALEQFKKVVDQPNWSFVEEPTDILSNNFRSAVNDSFKTAITLLQNSRNGQPNSIDFKRDIIRRIRTVFQNN